jgi:hypothetical protein
VPRSHLRLVQAPMELATTPKRRLHWTLRVSAILILVSVFALGTMGLTTIALQIAGN